MSTRSLTNAGPQIWNRRARTAGVGDHAVRELRQAELGVVAASSTSHNNARSHIPPMHQPWIAHTIGTRGGHQEAVGLAVPERDVVVVALAPAPGCPARSRRVRRRTRAPRRARARSRRRRALELLERGPELTLHVVAHRVELLGTVEGEDREMVSYSIRTAPSGIAGIYVSSLPAMVRSNVADTVVPSAAFGSR